MADLGYHEAQELYEDGRDDHVVMNGTQDLYEDDRRSQAVVKRKNCTKTADISLLRIKYLCIILVNLFCHLLSNLW